MAHFIASFYDASLGTYEFVVLLEADSYEAAARFLDATVGNPTEDMATFQKYAVLTPNVGNTTFVGYDRREIRLVEVAVKGRGFRAFVVSAATPHAKDARPPTVFGVVYADVADEAAEDLGSCLRPGDMRSRYEPAAYVVDSICAAAPVLAEFAAAEDATRYVRALRQRAQSEYLELRLTAVQAR